MQLISGRKKIQLKAILCGCLIDGTGRPALHDATIIVEGDKIAAVGSRKKTRIPDGAEIIDATGKTVTPGLIDSHTHFLGMGYSLTHLQLADARSMADITGWLRDHISKMHLTKSKWVQGRQWDDQNLKEGRYPTRHDLDPVSPHNPVALTRICGHMIILNTRALEACGINRDSPNPPGGVVDKDERGEPTGILRDARARRHREGEETRNHRLHAAELRRRVGLARWHVRQQGRTREDGEGQPL